MASTLKEFYRKIKKEALESASVAERLQGLSAEDRLRGLPVEERLKGLSRDEIEAFLNRLPREKSAED